MKEAAARRMMQKKMTFGMHKGCTLAHLAQFEPSYLDWVYSNKLCTIDVIHARDRGHFKHKKLRDGYAQVWTGGVLTYSRP